MKEKVLNLDIIYHKTIKVVGVTFNNHPKNIHKIIKNGLEYKIFKRFSGLKDKEVIKQDIKVREFDYECLSDVILEVYKYKGKDAIKVLINDFDDNYLEVGSIPASEVNTLLPLLKEDVKIDAYLSGGNLKNVLDNKINIEELNLGISLDIIIKPKK